MASNNHQGVSVWRKTTVANAVIFVLLLICAILTLFPLYWMIVTSFREPSIVIELPPNLLPWPLTLKNFQRILRANNGVIFNWLYNSVIMAAGVTLGNVFFGTLAGYTLAKGEFPGKKLIFWIVVGVMMVPGQLTIVPLYILVTNLGWLDTHWALILPELVTPYGIFLMKQFLQTLPDELMDAARIDGCGELTIYLRIILPLAKPGMAVLGIFTFMGNWNSFLWPLVVTTSNTMRTLQPGLATLQALQAQTNYGLLMAGASFAAIPMFIVFFAFQKYFVQGITVGALKG